VCTDGRYCCPGNLVIRGGLPLDTWLLLLDSTVLRTEPGLDHVCLLALKQFVRGGA
jgi:hypothetical protein